MSGREIRFDPTREEQELRSYLGDNFDRRLLENWERTLEEEFQSCGDEQSFYRSSNAYLYNLTVFAMSGTKLPYVEELARRIAPGDRVLDYGCGIGSDGLMLLEAGYRVEFADFDNPSVEYLRWRLEQRGLDAPIHDIDTAVPGGFDAAYAFDVIEHVGDPFAFLREMESRAKLVEVNFLEPDENDLHHPLPINGLVRRAMGRGLLGYRIFYGRSHLVLYRPDKVGPLTRAANLWRFAAARMRRALRIGDHG